MEVGGLLDSHLRNNINCHLKKIDMSEWFKLFAG